MRAISRRHTSVRSVSLKRAVVFFARLRERLLTSHRTAKMAEIPKIEDMDDPLRAASVYVLRMAGQTLGPPSDGSTRRSENYQSNYLILYSLTAFHGLLVGRRRISMFTDFLDDEDCLYRYSSKTMFQVLCLGPDALASVKLLQGVALDNRQPTNRKTLLPEADVTSAVLFEWMYQAADTAKSARQLRLTTCLSACAQCHVVICCAKTDNKWVMYIFSKVYHMRFMY